jgi:hypothetical protein
MKDVPRLLRDSARSFVIAFGLILLCFPICAISQENTNPQPPNQPIPIKIGTIGNEYAPAGFTRLYIFSVLKRHASIVVSRNGDAFLNLDLERGDDCSGNGSLDIRLPATTYTVSVNSEGYVRTSVDVAGASTVEYVVDVGTHDQGCLPGISPARGKAATTTGPDNGQAGIQQQIDRIAKGAHQEFPAPTESSLEPGQAAGWSIKNATEYDLHLYLSGPTARSYVITSGGSITVDLPSGSYRIAADVGHGVLPFYAVRRLGDARWSSHFYIAKQ